jgi:hypothetical protein
MSFRRLKQFCFLQCQCLHKMCNGLPLVFLHEHCRKSSPWTTLFHQDALNPMTMESYLSSVDGILRNESDFFRWTLNCPTDTKYCLVNDINLYRYCAL